MPYTIGEMAHLAGISVRTLHHYDRIGLLTPSARTPVGYRQYSREDVARLQQILFYRELGFALDEIAAMLSSPDFDAAAALRRHRLALTERRRRIDALLANIDRTLSALEGGKEMNDQQRFEGFGSKLVAENEQKYGSEIREKYGEDAVNRANQKVSKMTKDDWDRLEGERTDIYQALCDAMPQGADSPAAQAAITRYVAYLGQFGDYPPQALRGLGDMYVQDERFTKHYEDFAPGLAAFVRDAMYVYADGLEG